MGLPDDDKGPAWLRDWGSDTGYTETVPYTGYVDSSALSVDINDLLAFAEALEKEHTHDFREHVREVFELMAANPPSPDARFEELVGAMKHHRDMLVLASTTMKNHDVAVMQFVAAAREIGAAYRCTDELTSATVRDVESRLVETTPPPGGNNSQTPQTPLVTPEQAAETTPEAPPADNPSTTSGAPDGGRDLP